MGANILNAISTLRRTRAYLRAKVCVPYIPQNTLDLREVFVATLESIIILVAFLFPGEKLQHKRQMLNTIKCNDQSYRNPLTRQWMSTG